MSLGLCDMNAERDPGVAPDDLRRAMSGFATGVTIITACAEDWGLCGLTANAFSSVSLEPPLILACISYNARCYRAIRTSGVFGVHILRGDQDELARSFARKGAERTGVCEWSETTYGVPILSDFQTALECAVHEIHQGGDHAILVGRVLDAHFRDDRDNPLLYYQGRMFPLAAGAATPRPARQGTGQCSG